MALRKLVFILAFTLVNTELPVDYVVDIDVGTLDDSTSVNRNNEATTFRLPEDFDPIHCEIEITPYFDEAPTGKDIFTFDGKAMLRIKALKDNLQRIIINDNVRNITDIKIIDANDEELSLEYDRISDFQLLRINLTTAHFENGEIYQLYIDYIGNINETPLSRGMFRGYYIENNQTRWFAATHLQPLHSRQLFPSFDEPGYKSTFDIIVNRPAHFSETFSNMRMISNTTQGDRVREVFDTTPRMSAYLISIHISEGFQVIADNNDDEKSYRIIARPTANGQGQYALEVGPPITKWLEDYLGIEYYTMSNTSKIKNDQLASPFWASGATENWGLVTYREVRLLYEEGETNALDKMYIGTITAHELAHKWFGNYITCRWWDNVWINEGFASYFEYFAMDGVDGDMELERQFNIMYLQSALSADSAVNTRALQHTVNTPTEVTGHFSGISYTKGASLLLMLKHFVTEATFKKALNKFLVDRAYQHAFPEHLYAAFESATTEDGTLIDNVNITDFMRIWVDQVGYPVLNVDVSSTSIKLSQERFYITTPEQNLSQDIWPLPLTYTSGDSPNWDNLTVSYVLTEKEEEIVRNTGEEYIIFNVQQKGLYRVNYDSANWDKIATALNTTYGDIHELNRAQIVDDVFALMRSERLNFNQGFRILEFLKKDTNYYSWYPAITGFTWIRNRFLHLPDDLAEFDEVLLEYLDAVIENVGYNHPEYDVLTRTLNRLFVLAFACNIGHKGCVDDALKKFEDFKNGTVLNPNLRRHVLCTGLREGNYEDWQFLNERRRRSNNQADEVVMIRALGCTTNEAAINETLEIILSDEVKAQDRLNALTWLFSGTRGNARVALQFLKEEGVIDRVRQSVVLPASFNSVLANLAANLDVDGLDDMEEWLEANEQTIPEYNVGLNSIRSARINMEWGTERVREIIKAFRGSGSILVPTTSLLIMTLLALMLR